MIMLVAMVGYVHAASAYYVTATGSGSKNGMDWNNAYAGFGTGGGQANPSSMVRGATYYVAGGGSYSGQTFSTPASGTLAISIIGATAANHGTNTGWSNSYSVSAADGGSSAIWTSAVTLSTSYQVFDGQVPTGTLWDQNPNDYGFRFSNGLCGDIVLGTPSVATSNYYVAHVSSVGFSFYADPGKDACPYSEDFFLSAAGGYSSTNNVTVSNSLSTGWEDVVVLASSNYPMKNWVIQYNVFNDTIWYSDAHAEDISGNYGYPENTTVRYNLFENAKGATGSIVISLNWNSENTYIYGNVFYKDNDDNGVIAIGSKGLYTTNLQIYNNVFDDDTVNPVGLGLSGYTFNNCIFENNMVYNMPGGLPAGCSADYNAYFSASSTNGDAHIQTGSGNPFVNDAAGNFALKANTNPGTSLPAPYNIDPLGNVRATWTRGAFEYSGSGSTSVSTTTPTSTTSVSISTTSIATTTAPTTTIPTTTTSISTVSTSSTVTTTIFQAGTNYVPITITNGQGSATGSNFQEMVTFNPSTYSSYEKADLGNIRFAQGPSELYSWCESGCGSASSNAVFWVKVPNVPAGGNIKINMTFQPPSTEYDGVYAGEAPQLSAAFGQYDNGKRVFNLYTNSNLFSSSSIPGGWASSGSTCDGVTAYCTYNTTPASPPFVLDSYGRYISGSGSYIDFPSYGSSAGNPFVGVGNNAGTSQICLRDQSNVCVGQVSPYSTTNSIYTISVASLSSESGQVNYGSAVSTSYTLSGTLYPQVFGSYGTAATVWFRSRAYPPAGVMPSASFGALNSGSGGSTTTIAQSSSSTTTTVAQSSSSTTTTVVRSSSTTTTVAQSSSSTTSILTVSTSTTSTSTSSTTIIPLSAPTAPTVSASKLDVGQLVTFSTYVTNGASPYSYNFIISNSVNGTIIAYSGPQSYNSVSYPTASAGSIHANVIVTDNEVSPVTKSSVYSSTFLVAPAPAAVSLTPSSSAITLGQSVTFNVLVSGGTGPFILRLTSSNGLVVNTVSSAAGTATFGAITPAFNPSAYNVVGTDTGTTSQFIFNSTQSSVTVTNAPTTTTIPPTSVSTTTASPTTTVSGGNPGGPGGPTGGSSLPTVTHTGACYVVSNYTQKNTESFELNGTWITSVVNFIGPTDAGVTVNGRIYESVVQGQNYTILSSPNYTYTMGLLNISYLPVEDTIRLGFCGEPNLASNLSTGKILFFNTGGAVSNIPITTNPVTTPGFGFWPGNLSVTSNRTSNTPIYVNVSEAVAPLPKFPSNYSLAVAINITVKKRNLTNSSVYTTLGYDCAINGSRVAPFLLSNGTWGLITPFTVNRELCTITFRVPADPVVALLIQNRAAPTTSEATTVPAKEQGHGGPYYIVLSGLALAAIAASMIWLYLRGKGRTAPPGPQPDRPKVDLEELNKKLGIGPEDGQAGQPDAGPK